jgi:hypothetical protein
LEKAKFAIIGENSEIEQALIETVRALPLTRKESPCYDALKDVRLA